MKGEQKGEAAISSNTVGGRTKCGLSRVMYLE